MMYDINVYAIPDGESNVKAKASICFENSFKIEGIRLVDGKNGLFMSMPSYKVVNSPESEQTFKNICYPNKELWGKLQSDLIDAYGKACESGKRSYRSDCYGTPEQISVSNVRVTPQHGPGSLHGLATVTLNDSFYVNNIRIFENDKGEPFISMPSFKRKAEGKDGKDEYRDVCYPVTADFRKEIIGKIKEEYAAARDKGLDSTDKSGEEFIPIPDEEISPFGGNPGIADEREKSAEVHRKPAAR